MRGRAQAIVIALIGSWFPLISPATAALVSLRRGPLDGSLILLWALLPALAAFWLSDMGPLMPSVTLLGLLLTFVMALVLRNSSNWSACLMGLVTLSCLGSLVLASSIPDPVADVTEALGDMLKQMQEQAQQTGEPSPLSLPSETFVVGLVGYVMAVNALLSLLLARWWQAMLYNPGGLQTEFHQVRLGPVPALVCFAATLYCWRQGLDYQHWASLFALPLMVTGAAIAHRLVKARGMGAQWLILFYLVLLFAGPLIIVLALLDTWTDFRSRLAPATSEIDKTDDRDQ
jgi:hypothetical protein